MSLWLPTFRPVSSWCALHRQASTLLHSSHTPSRQPALDTIKTGSRQARHHSLQEDTQPFDLRLEPKWLMHACMYACMYACSPVAVCLRCGQCRVRVCVPFTCAGIEWRSGEQSPPPTPIRREETARTSSHISFAAFLEPRSPKVPSKTLSPRITTSQRQVSRPCGLKTDSGAVSHFGSKVSWLTLQ